MSRLLSGLVHALAGYVALALLGYVLIGQLSSNTHDRSVEAAMTAVFAAGPLGGILGFVIGFVRSRRVGRSDVPRD